MAIRIIDPKKDANKIIDTFIEKNIYILYNPFCEQRGSTTTVRPSQTITLSHPDPMVALESHLDMADQSTDSNQDAAAEGFASPYQLRFGPINAEYGSHKP